MSAKTDLDTYIARAAAARAAAEKAELGNVRDRCLRAAAAWDQMAERVRRTESMRASLQAEKDRVAGGEPPSQPAWPTNIEAKKPRLNERQT
jgi:hypothetical protein